METPGGGGTIGSHIERWGSLVSVFSERKTLSICIYMRGELSPSRFHSTALSQFHTAFSRYTSTEDRELSRLATNTFLGAPS